MIATDTNVLVRLLVNDDEAQGSRARAAFEVEDIWIGKTVLLETFWVLRSAYDFDDMAIARAIEGANAQQPVLPLVCFVAKNNLSCTCYLYML